PGDAHDACHPDDLLRADYGAAGSIRKLFTAAADRGEGDGLPAPKHAVLLVHAARFPGSTVGILCEWRCSDLRMDTLSSAQRDTKRGSRPRHRNGPLDSKHRTVLFCLGPRLDQLHRYGARPSRTRDDDDAAAAPGV